MVPGRGSLTDPEGNPREDGMDPLDLGSMLGEDIGFGLSAAELGYDGRYIGLRCDHLMHPEDVERHRRECPLCANP